MFVQMLADDPIVQKYPQYLPTEEEAAVLNQ